MMSKTYDVLARKYRPKRFVEVLRQDTVLKVLQNSIKYNKVHHAYVITGIRGTGKTSIARILAKAINCEFLDDNLIEPCLSCKSCTSIQEGKQQDVVEIDAASNTGIADIKEILENSRYRPILIKRKVYLIDEVHMLSNSAFNALLKILEEPPEYVNFILATTEIKKIPITILSRCQRLDLRRLKVDELSNYLIEISKKEGRTLSQSAAELLAKSAEGSIRDGLSLLDQAMLIGENSSIAVNDVRKMLCVVEFELVAKLFGFIIKGEVIKALDIIEELYNDGASLYNLLEELLDMTYNISLCKLGNVKGLISSEELKIYEGFSKILSNITIIRLWQTFGKAIQELKVSHNELQSLKMSIMRIMHINFSITPEELLIKKNNSDISINTINDLLEFLSRKWEIKLFNIIQNNLFIVRYEPGFMEIDSVNSKGYDVKTLRTELHRVTNINWKIEESEKVGINHINTEKLKVQHREQELKEDELSKNFSKNFPELKISDIRLIK